ncbi:MAG TPA: glycosyltransferase family 2 protein [Candidatus Sulfotelmatobacter sp.]|jgi:glycosyltransferase involved in cell wall biosynthesis|nr:glycosyltransferase family 2 protein [Candidatus Sulfotelmatobacter sp.]
MKKKRTSRVVIVMPGFNVARTIKDTYSEIPLQFRKHIIFVDNNSSDNSVNIAKKLGMQTFIHPQNLGYGGSQKTCYWEALKYKPDVIVMLHPDYQYDGSKIPDLIQPILNGKYDFMFGSRMQNKTDARKGGMPTIKFYINRIVCWIENKLLGVTFSEHFSGLRAYSPRLLLNVPFLRFSNDFVFDQQMEIAAISYGFEIGEIAIPTRYHERASSIQFLKGTKFLLDTFYYLLLFKLHQMRLIHSNLFLQTTKTLS